MNEVTYIYSLSCPITKQVKYIGKSNDVNKRFSAHINNTSAKTKKNSWIISLKNKNLKPILTIIDCVSIDDWQFYEKHYIKLFMAMGANITNGTSGGDGSSLAEKLKNIPRQKEVKDKISLSKIGHIVTEETRQKLSEKLKDYKHTDSAKTNMGVAQKSIWKNYTDELKKQRLDKLKATSEKRKKQVEMYKDNILINSFASARDAALTMNLCYKKISDVCNQKRITHGGYTWKFKTPIFCT